MASQKLPEFFFGLRREIIEHYPVILRALAGGILALLLINWLVPGQSEIRDVQLRDAQAKHKATVVLPYNAPQQGERTLTFSIPIYRSAMTDLFPRQLWNLGCIHSIALGENTLYAAPKGGECKRVERQFFADLPLPAMGAITLDVTVSTNGPVMFGIYRMPLVSAQTMLWGLVLAAYLFSLSFVRDMRQCYATHHLWLIVCVFIASLGATPVDMALLRDRLAFMANGVAVAACVGLGLFFLPLQRSYAWAGQMLARINAWPARYTVGALALAFLLLAASLSQILFHGVPHVADTHVQYMHSKIIAQGHFYQPSHVLRDFFYFQNVVNNGKYFSIVFPGNPILLAAMQILGVPWLLNPLMGALTVVAMFLLAREVAGRQAGLIAAALMLIAPNIIFMSSEYMNHAATLFFLCMFLFCYLRMHNLRSGKWALAAGFFVGWAMLVRLHSAVPFALPVALHALFVYLRTPRTRRYMLPLAAGFGVCVLFLMYYNYVTNGNVFYSHYLDFGSNRRIASYLDPARWHYLFVDLYRAQKQLLYMHKELFGWPTSSLWGVLLFFLIPGKPRYTGLLFACWVGQFLALVFIYPDMGSLFYPRYIYESYAIVLVFTAIAIHRIAMWLIAQDHRWLSPAQASGGVFFVLLTLALLAFPYYTMEKYRMYKSNYWEGNWPYHYMISHSVQAPALVIVSPYARYRQLYFNQPPDDASPIIYALDQGEAANKLLMQHYAARNVYLVKEMEITRIR